MSEEFIHKPYCYWYYVKKAVRICFPMGHDFYGLGDALKKVGEVLLVMFVRATLLLTFPVSVPLVALMSKKADKRSLDRRVNMLTEEWHGYPPEFSREELEPVLRGEITLTELRKSKNVE